MFTFPFLAYLRASGITAPPSFGQNFVSEEYWVPQITHLGVNFSGETSFAPSAEQNEEPAGYVL